MAARAEGGSALQLSPATRSSDDPPSAPCESLRPGSRRATRPAPCSCGARTPPSPTRLSRERSGAPMLTA
eukprot:154789-Alexandrium_andersonii.AAC.1